MASSVWAENTRLSACAAFALFACSLCFNFFLRLPREERVGHVFSGERPGRVSVRHDFGVLVLRVGGVGFGPYSRITADSSIGRRRTKRRKGGEGRVADLLRMLEE